MWLPVNPTEFHGPHLSLRNDALLSAGLARDLYERMRARWPDWPMLEARDLEVGVQPVPGPGSRGVSYKTACSLVVAACRALADMGARRVVLATFHGSPLHGLALDAGVRYLRARGVHAAAPFNLLLYRLLQIDPSTFRPAYDHIADPAERAEMIASYADDFHAGFLETSIALHYAPDSVHPRFKDLPDCPHVQPDLRLGRASAAAAKVGRARLARELGIAAFGNGWYSLRPFPGYTGRPRHASAAAGAFFACTFADLVEQDVADCLDGRPPPHRPLAWWLPALSLQGRWGGAHVPLDQVEAGFPREGNG